MEHNNIIAAPQVADVNYFYRKWKESHVGSRSDFYKFMTTPSLDRDVFLSQWPDKAVVNGSIVSIILTKD